MKGTCDFSAFFSPPWLPTLLIIILKYKTRPRGPSRNTIFSDVFILTLESSCEFFWDNFLGSILEGLQLRYSEFLFSMRLCITLSVHLFWTWLSTSESIQWLGCKSCAHSEDVLCYIHLCISKYSTKGSQYTWEVLLVHLFFYLKVVSALLGPDILEQNDLQMILSLWLLRMGHCVSIGVNVVLPLFDWQFVERPGWPHLINFYMKYTTHPFFPGQWGAFFCSKTSLCVYLLQGMITTQPAQLSSFLR